MLDLIELTNREVLWMLGWTYAFGLLSGVILFYMPVRTKLDTLLRNRGLDERVARMEHSSKCGEYKQFS